MNVHLQNKFDFFSSKNNYISVHLSFAFIIYFYAKKSSNIVNKMVIKVYILAITIFT